MDGEGWVIISDQQKGLLNAVQTWAPNAENRNCARHIYANWRKKFKDREWQRKFWRCAKAPCISLFNLARAKLAQSTRDGAEALMNTDPHHWSRAWFRLGSNCDSVDNSMCEFFNKWIVEARFLPIISMLEAIRCKVMVRIQVNRTKAEKWQGIICPNIMKKLNAYINESGYCHAIFNGKDSFEVKHHDHRFTVNLQNKTCSCRYWELSGLPCCHAISCIYYNTNRLDDYIASCYSVHEFNKTYDHCLEPVEGMHSWPASEKPQPQAPKYVRMPGRPKKERKREPHEKPKATRVSKVGTVIRCRFCKGSGHNISSCSKRKETLGASNTIARAVPEDIPPSAPTAMVMMQGSQQSSASVGQKRASLPANSKGKKKCTGVAYSSAKASVTTSKGGSASIRLEANVPTSQASSCATIQLSSGHASANVTAKEPPRKKPPKKRTRTVPKLLMSSNDVNDNKQ